MESKTKSTPHTFRGKKQENKPTVSIPSPSPPSAAASTSLALALAVALAVVDKTAVVTFSTTSLVGGTVAGG